MIVQPIGPADRRDAKTVMRLLKKDQLSSTVRPSWRDYQKRLQRPGKRFTGRHMIIFSSLIMIGVLSLYLGLSPSSATNTHQKAVRIDTPPVSDIMISKKDVQLLLTKLDLNDLLAQEIDLPFKSQRFKVHTTLDVNLQNELIRMLDRKNSRYVGVVVMEADTGRVISLVGFNKADAEANPCLKSTFPAASLFKIVTAAAAVDKFNYTGNTILQFNGYKHTLYKSQLKDINNRYTHTISFADSFAQSVNPIFGKIGMLRLGKAVLEQYGTDFGFNQPLDFELPVAPSHLSIDDDDPYRLAEIASGFNKETTISPLHAAMIVSAVLNKGRMVAPTLIERIEDGKGRLLYHSETQWPHRAMTAKASAILTTLMEHTVQSGTARRVFRGYGRDRVLSHLKIGGKTGSIFNEGGDAKFDWFIGFAQEENGQAGLIVAALVAHEEFIGVRAGTYARKAMSLYFEDHLAGRDTRSAKAGG